ncbi:MANSC domain-containing protein 1 [Hemicordylus capensis]|uniref:MANSC domain-containing protein 1 n=1 Tax=Hemicordylus capensis TaxID=884348 RepID=UPI0023036771|nr:MANSC domain-containing protein 1 [Hemicordylus capensis]XP_053109274.1 MANSC domain-containing protein 1 [Hemicordylus capensis]XP_053109275.1 MANSC domain-containing protein 1 [Hemicordylus capensis]
MSTHITWCSACILALVAFVVLEPSQSQACSTEKMENITVDIKAALSKGIRGMDPFHIVSWEACVDVCCLGEKITGTENKKCNLVVFDTRRKGNYPNCYLFYYPSMETCPMKQAMGLVTSRIRKDAGGLKPTPYSNKRSPFIVNGNSMSPQTAMFDLYSPTRPPNVSSPSQRSIVSSDGHSQHPNGEQANQLKSLNSSLMHKNSSHFSTSTANTIKHVVPIVKPATVNADTQAGTVPDIIPYVSPSNATTTRTTTAYHRNVHVIVTPRSSTSASQPTTTSGTSTRNLSQLPLSTPNKIFSASLPDVHLGNGQWDLEGSILGGVQGKNPTPYFGGKNILLAALLFGVIFLLLVAVLVGRKMLESLQQRRYTRLDYLINGMYANM